MVRSLVLISLIRACVANEILNGRLCTRGVCVRGGWGGGAVLGIVGGGVTLLFLNGDAIPDVNMPFFIRLYALVVPLKTLPDFGL